MLTASELRIGNWLIKDGNPSQLDSIQRYSNGRYYLRFSDGIDREIESVAPIPVTFKLFQRTGLFKNKVKDIFEFSPNAEFFNNIGFSKVEAPSAPPLFGLYVHHTWITTYAYIHELQNLYFALTGEELELRL